MTHANVHKRTTPDMPWMVLTQGARAIDGPGPHHTMDGRANDLPIQPTNYPTNNLNN